MLSISEHDMYLDNLFSFMDVVKGENNEKCCKTLNTTGSHKIEFRNVSFTYPNSEKEILHNISFIINPGEKVMLMGGVKPQY